MEELNHSLAIELAEILGAFRKDDSVPMKYQMNQEHVEKWVCQFDEEYRNIILEEMIYIFKKNFYVRKDFEIFCENIIAKYEQITGNHANPLEDMCVINMQECGSRSQQILTEIFAEIYADKYNAEINQRIENQSRYIYIDDGLYSGRQVEKELGRLIEMVPAGSKIDMFFLVGYTNGIYMVERNMREYADSKNIKICLCHKFIFDNDKYVRIEDGTEVYSMASGVLWLHNNSKRIPEIQNYISSSNRPENNYWFRKERFPMEENAGIFSFEKNRNMVETQFALKGIEIYNSVEESKRKGMYPFGFDRYPGMGFGAMCATEFNISNNCPLVLWAEKIDGTSYENIEWYPLLPRRRRSEEQVVNQEPEEYPDDYYTYTYMTCPICGCQIGYFNDAGNGFCTDCTWREKYL